VSPAEELWVKIIEIDTQRRRISLSIKQALEGGEVSEEYREAFGAHAYDEEGNYIGAHDYSDLEFTPETEAQAAWADYAQEEAARAHDGDEPAEGAGEAVVGDAVDDVVGDVVGDAVDTVDAEAGEEPATS